MNIPRPFLFMRESFEHMTSISGFDALFTELGVLNDKNFESVYVSKYDLKPTKEEYKWLKQKLRIYKPQVPYGRSTLSPFVQYRHELAANKLVKLLVANPNSLLFLAFSENQYGSIFQSLPSELKKRIIIFVHQPPSWFKLNWKDLKEFSKLGAVITLSSEQTKFFKDISTTRIYQINHGVRLDFFKPPLDCQFPKQPTIVFVGHWLRDISTFERSIRLIKKEIPNLKINCVVPWNARERLEFLKISVNAEVSWFADLSNEELLKLYQEASLMFLPLIDSTANNAMNEAIACGLPVVTTDIGGTRDYLNPKFASFCEPHNHEQHAAEVIKWLNLIQQGKVNRSEIRKHAEENLNWKNIANSLWNEISHI
jgi:glycosyltransferase involved in cell wall biosynthesis